MCGHYISSIAIAIRMKMRSAHISGLCDADRNSLCALHLDRITCNILVERDSKLLFNARTKNRVYIERNAVIAFAFAFAFSTAKCATPHTGCMMMMMMLLLVHAVHSTIQRNKTMNKSKELKDEQQPMRCKGKHAFFTFCTLFQTRLAFTLVFALFNINFGCFALQINHQSWAQVFAAIIAYFLLLSIYFQDRIYVVRSCDFFFRLLFSQMRHLIRNAFKFYVKSGKS